MVGRWLWPTLTTLAVALLLAEAGLRAQAAWLDEPPSHPDRSVEHEWRWATHHLAAGEASFSGLAVYDPDLGWAARPNMRAERDGSTTNSAGMRATREFSEERVPGVPRLLLVGDSYTYGFNADDREVFADRLDLLCDCEVLNFGVSGYGPGQILLHYEKIGTRYHADVVVFGLYVRAFSRLFETFRGYAKPWFVLDERGELELRGRPVISPEDLLEEYRSGRREIRAWYHSYLLGSIARNLEKASARSGVTDEQWALMAAILERFRDRVLADGARPMLLIFPYRVGRHRETVHEEVELLAVAEANELGIPVLSLADGFRDAVERDPEIALYNPNDQGGHLSPRGNLLVAELLGEFLAEEGLLPSSGSSRSASVTGAPRDVTRNPGAGH